MIYLDHAATTPVPKAVADAMYTVLTEQYANPNAQYPFGQEMRRSVEDWRAVIAKAVGCEANQLFFTSCGTEGDNWAIRAACWQNRHVGRHIVTTAVEHHAVLHPMQKLEAKGFEVTYLQPDREGNITVDALKKALRPDTILVSVMMVNNETGAVMPIADMVKATRRLSPLALFHTDAVQGFLKVPFRARTLGADMISVSAHKIHAAKGTGALYIRPGLPLPPFLCGGGQESNYRSGTENMPGICGFGAACADTDAKAEIAHMAHLRDLTREALAGIDGLVLLGSQQAPHIVNLSLPGLRSQGIINCLQSEGIYVSAGSACSKGHRSHVLEAMGLPPAVIDGSIRVSFSRDNTEADVSALCQALAHAKQTLKG